MAKTVISLDTSIDVISKYNELVKESLGGDSVYIRTKETLQELFEDGVINGLSKAEVLTNVLSNINNSIVSSSMSTALAWAAKEKEIVLQKEELEWKLDLLKVQTATAEQESKMARVARHTAEASLMRNYGADIVYVDDAVASLPDNGKSWEEYQLVKQNAINAEVQERALEAQIKQANAGTHKIVADTYVNHGMFSGYTITDTGITGTQKLNTGYTTLSDMNRFVASEQAKGYVYNAYSNAASSSSGMIGTLVAAEIPGLDPSSYLNTWKSAVDKLNNLVVPTISVTI